MVDETFQNVISSVRYLGHSIIAREILQDVVYIALRESQGNTLRSLNDQLQQAESALSESRDSWSQLDFTLSKEHAKLFNSLKATETQLRQCQQQKELLESKLENLQFQEQKAIEEKEMWSTRRDLSQLPSSVQCTVVGFLSSRDLSQAMLTCRVWRRTLHRGDIWKSLLIWHHRRSLLQKQEEEKKSYLNPPLQRSVTVFLRDTNETLTKDSIFAKASSQLQAQISQAKSLKEDLQSRITADQQVKHFLTQKLEQLRHQLGESLVSKGRLESSMAVDTVTKATLARKLRQLETLIEEEEQKRDDLVRNTELALQNFDEQIKSFEDTHAPVLAERERDIVQLKTQKKVLVKEVKALRVELTNLQASRDHARQALAQYRNHLSGLAQI